MKFRCITILILLFVGACTGEAPREAVGPGPGKELLSLLPVESNFLMYANLEAIRQTPLGRQWQADLEQKVEADIEDEGYRDFVEATGLDPKRDLHEIWVAAVFSKKEHENDSEEGGAILRGKLDRGRILDYLRTKKEKDVREQAFMGHTIYTFEDDDDDISFAFLTDETVVVGDEGWLRGVLKRNKSGGRSVLDNPTMANSLDEITFRKHVWGIINVDELAEEWAEEIRERGSRFKGTRSIENMKAFVFYAQFRDKADVRLKGLFESEEEAKLLEEMLTGFKAMAKLMVSDDREAVDMLNDIEIRTKGTVLEISGRIGQDFVRKVEQKSQILKGQQLKLL